MEKNKKAELREILFRHLDGIVIAPTVNILKKYGITDFIITRPHFKFSEICENFEVNPGYLNVALRLFSSQGWLDRKIEKNGVEISFCLTKDGAIALGISEIYSSFCAALPELIDIDNHLFQSGGNYFADKFSELANELKTFSAAHPDKTSTGWVLAKHVEGIITGPVLVSLGMIDFFNNLDSELDPAEYDFNPALFSVILQHFSDLGWLEENGEKWSITETGSFFFKRSVAYGVTVSYLSTFNQVSELIFGDPHSIWKRTATGLETHVNRRMNVWGSGGAHSLYFRKIDEIIIDIFNKPLDSQPVGIADMGCGDGTMLKHLYNVVKTNTLRGKNLKTHPIAIVGADFNRAAREASTITLTDAGIDHFILHGDITRPNAYARNLKEQFNLDLQELLNVRSFLDHNRIYAPPKKPFDNRTCRSTGAFSFRGRWIPNNELKENLVEHLKAWTPYVGKFGLLVLELHTIKPETARQFLGKTVATAYDGTHGYSDQYIMEIDTFLNAADEAGLVTLPAYQAKFPDNESATISINLFRAKD